MVVSQVELEEALEKQCVRLTELFNNQKEELLAKFETIQSNLLDEIASLKPDMEISKKEAGEAKTLASQNADEIKRLQSTIFTLVEQNQVEEIM